MKKNIFAAPKGFFKRLSLLKSRKAFAIPYAVFMLLFVVFPLLLIIFYAFTVPDEAGALVFGLENFLRFFKDYVYLQVFIRSVLVGLATTVICLIIGYPIAYILSNKKYNRSSTAYMLFVLPMWMNFLLRTVATKELFFFLGINLGGLGPVMFGMVYNFLPFMILPLYNVLSKMDKNLLEAASDLGANERQVFFKTIVPLSMPGVVSGFLMVFMPTISTYVITDLLSNNTYSLFGNIIFNETNTSSYYGAGCALSIIMLIIIGLTVMISNKYDKLGESKGEGLW
jgi:spermidine/putrescine transport system permease protein